MKLRMSPLSKASDNVPSLVVADATECSSSCISDELLAKDGLDCSNMVMVDIEFSPVLVR